jgi:cytochrome bd ubiquinol oxidase subunit II
VSLETVWFVLIAVLWGGYFLLEGFDFGVGMLLPVLPRDERERGIMFESIGPVWDGNEVWLVVAAGGTFAAFPAWYATMFSGFYLALLLILVLLIVRVVSFEWREKREDPGWRRTWLWANTIGSLGAPFLWGIALANLVHGLPLDSSHEFTGNILDLFSPYTVLAGLAVVAIFAAHGATYLTLRTTGALHERAVAAARRLSVPAFVLGAGVAAWTVAVAHDTNNRAIPPTAIVAALTAAALILGVALTRTPRGGWAFAATGLAAIGFVATIFTGLYPRVLVSDPTFANSLTITNAASGQYALKVITIVAAIFTPLILLYQGWTYHVFRTRLGGEPLRAAPPPVREGDTASGAGGLDEPGPVPG